MSICLSQTTTLPLWLLMDFRYPPEIWWGDAQYNEADCCVKQSCWANCCAFHGTLKFSMIGLHGLYLSDNVIALSLFKKFKCWPWHIEAEWRIYASLNWVTIGSDNGLSPGRRQAIIWTNAGILLIGPLGTNFSENLIAILTFSFTKMRLKVSSAKWRPFCLGLNVLKLVGWCTMPCSRSLLKIMQLAKFCTSHGTPWNFPW